METTTITVDHKRGLYILQTEEYYSTHGIDVVQRRSENIIKWIKGKGEEPIYKMVEYATVHAYEQYKAIMNQAQEFCKKNNIQCEIELEAQLIGLEGKRVEVIDKYGEKRRFWVGRTTGWLPGHIELSKSNSSGGFLVMGTPFQKITVIRDHR